MRHPHGETITRLRGVPSANPYSGETDALDWTTPDMLAISGCAVEQDPTNSPLEVGRDSVEVDFTLYTPFGADIMPLDRLLVRGLECDVLGVRVDWHNPFSGDDPGSQVHARAVIG